MDVAIDLKVNQTRQLNNFKGVYKIVSETLYQHELGKYHTYGIQIIMPDCTGILHDVSVDEKTTKHIVEILNRYQVSPIHLYDVVTDMLP